MPYKTVQGGGRCGDSQWAVLKGSRTFGCHDTKEAAQRQVRALNAAESPAQALVRQLRVEAELEPVFRDALRRVARKVLSTHNLGSLTAAISSPYDVSMMLALWNAEVDTTVHLALTQAFTAQSVHTGAQVPPNVWATVFPNVRDARASEWWGTVENRIKGVGETIYNDLTDSLREGFDAGESPRKLADRVRHTLGVGVDRATVIARTEAAAVVNGADHSVAQELQASGVVTKRQWLATTVGPSAKRTRHTHRQANETEEDDEGYFTVGAARLSYPGDPAGPADEVINCRCSTLMILSEVEDGVL